MSNVSHVSHDARQDLFVFIGAALATAFGLFAAQAFYASCIDRAYHEELASAGPSQALLDKQAAWDKALQSGKLPLEQAKKLAADKGRGGVGSVAPVFSEDLSAISGWIHRPNFKLAIAHPIRTARDTTPIAVAPEPAAPTDAAAAAPVAP
jgi:hypothetical protein